MEFNIEKDENIIFKSKISKTSFILRNIPNIILKIGYFLFSIHWIYRFFQIKTSLLFLIMGLFFMFTSLYFLFYPLSIINKLKYILTKENFYYIGSFWEYKSIKNFKIKEFKTKRSIIDKLKNTLSFEIIFSSSDSENDYIELFGIINYQDLIFNLRKIMVNKQIKEETPLIKKNKNGISKDFYKKYNKIFFLIIILTIISGLLLTFNSIKNIFQTENRDSQNMSSLPTSNAFLYAELSKPIEEKNLGLGMWGKGSSCCYEFNKNSLFIKIPFDDSPKEEPSLTIYLVNLKTLEPLKKLTKEYIKKVYLCFPNNLKPKNDFIDYFGKDKILKDNCKGEWLEESCCIQWTTPQ